MFCKDIGSSSVINDSIHFDEYVKSYEIKIMAFVDGLSFYYTPNKFQNLLGVLFLQLFTILQ